VRTFENLLDITAQTYNILQRRFKNNVDVSKLELNQAQTSLEERRAELIQAKNRVRDFSDKIKELMADPEFPVTSPALIQPSDQPVEEPLNFDVSDQINTGLENRLELAQEIYKIDLADITAQVGKNNLLPQFNLVGSIGNQGEGNNEGDAFRNQWTFGHIDYGIGFQFEYPLGNRAAEAIWKRTLLQRMQEIERYRSFIDQVSYDVKVAINDEQSAWEQIIATRESRLAADAALANIHDREKAGEPLTPTFVQLKLDLQDRLANAEQQEHAAISQYNVSILQLERSKGTLLKYLNVVMEESPDLFPTKKWMAHHQSELQN
jgi:outer membrane protein TolC